MHCIISNPKKSQTRFREHCKREIENSTISNSNKHKFDKSGYKVYKQEGNIRQSIDNNNNKNNNNKDEEKKSRK